MKLRVYCLVTVLSIALVACGPGYDTHYPARDHVAAFTPVAAVYSTVLTTYNAQYANGSEAPLTIVSIIVATDANLCADLSATISPLNGARLILQGMIDGDVTHALPSTTWSNITSTWSNNPSQLDECYAIFLGYDGNGMIDASLGANSGSVSFASAGNSNAATIHLDYDLDMQVTGAPQSMTANAVAAASCAN